MKKLLLVVLAVVSLASCAKDYTPKTITVPPIAPRVEKVEIQAKVATAQTEKTVELAAVVEKKYKQDADVAAVVESARIAVVENKKTQFEIDFLKAAAAKNDSEVLELQVESVKKDEFIAVKQQEIVKEKAKVDAIKTDLIKEQAKVSKKNGYLLAAFAALVVMGAVVLKPWKWFI